MFIILNVCFTSVPVQLSWHEGHLNKDFYIYYEGSKLIKLYLEIKISYMYEACMHEGFSFWSCIVVNFTLFYWFTWALVLICCNMMMLKGEGWFTLRSLLLIKCEVIIVCESISGRDRFKGQGISFPLELFSGVRGIRILGKKLYKFD